jgi:hypothetical protein
METNRLFRGIVSFQELSRRFVSLFSHFLSGADLATAHFKSNLVTIVDNSEKGKLLSVKREPPRAAKRGNAPLPIQVCSRCNSCLFATLPRCCGSSVARETLADISAAANDAKIPTSEKSAGDRLEVSDAYACARLRRFQRLARQAAFLAR